MCHDTIQFIAALGRVHLREEAPAAENQFPADMVDPTEPIHPEIDSLETLIQENWVHPCLRDIKSV